LNWAQVKKVGPTVVASGVVANGVGS